MKNISANFPYPAEQKYCYIVIELYNTTCACVSGTWPNSDPQPNIRQKGHDCTAYYSYVEFFQ